MSKTPLENKNQASVTPEASAVTEENTKAQPLSEEEKAAQDKVEKTADEKETVCEKGEKDGKTSENEVEDKKQEKKKKKEKKKKAKPKDIKAATKRLFSYLSPFKGRLVLVAILVILGSIITILSSITMFPVYNILTDVVKGVQVDNAFGKISFWLVLMGVGYILGAACNLSYQRIMLTVSARTLANMRRDLFNHLQSLPLEFFDKRKTGAIMSHFTNDVGRINDLVSNYLPTLISSSISAVMTITIMLCLSWKLTLTITIAIVLMFSTVFLITAKCAPLFKKQQKAVAEMNGFTEEYIKGIKIVKLFSHEQETKDSFSQLNENYRKTGVKANIIGGFMSPLMSLITRLNYAIVVFYGASLVLSGQMTVSALVNYVKQSQGYASPIISISSCYSSLISALAGAERVFEVLDTPSETDEGRVTLVRILRNALGETEETEDTKGELNWKVPTEDGFEYVKLGGNICVKDVSFAYVEDTDVLKNVSVEAESGTKVAFVGSTGAGKTTITNLINRFYEIDRGQITYDGIDIKDIKKDDLRHSMAMVLQDTKLFAGTIADNIRYGKLDATDEEVIAAAKIANAHSFIEKLPDGYDSEIRADGVNLSVGQAQLINIARAAIAGAPLLILDEATSSVDTRTERLIEVGMDSIMENRTVFVIAHRLSTVRNSEKIIVLEKGEIIEEGNHDSLIAQKGKYYQLYTGTFEME